jgi:hypothetical protein
MNATIDLTPKAEPVPAASQLAILPFLSALEGILRSNKAQPTVRLTVHRVMNRGREVYLQQICDYVGSDGGGAGRIFAVTTGIIGASFSSGNVFHTRRYSNRVSLVSDLRKDMREGNDPRKVSEVALSYIAVPFIGADGAPIMILYGDSKVLNLFSSALVTTIVDACHGLCRVLDRIGDEGFKGLKNFPLILPGDAKYVRSNRQVYRRLQRSSTIRSPRFEVLTSFNFEAQS